MSGSPRHKSTSSDEQKLDRLQKVIAQSGLTSRRKAEELILQGRVAVNGRVVTELGTKVSTQDKVEVDGNVLQTPKLYVIAMNKPKGVLTTLQDPQRRKTVKDLLPDLGVALKPVGRLDKDTEGLLLFTNDGELAARLTHAKWGVGKEYLAKVSGAVQNKTLEKLRQGIYLEGGKTAPAVFEIVHTDIKTDTTNLRIILHEGRKRQIRLMCAMVGHPVQALKRVRVGNIHLGKIAPGICRLLTQTELNQLRRSVGLAK